MNRRSSKITLQLGYAAMLLGALDPLEGALLILPGSMLVAFATRGRTDKRSYVVRLGFCLSIATGVAALFGLSAAGGFGGSSGLSNWWGVLILPYLVGWSFSVWWKDTPRWVTFAGIGVGLWYLAIVAMMTRSVTHLPDAGLIALVIGTLAVVTMIGCVYRLKSGVSSSASTGG